MHEPRTYDPTIPSPSSPQPTSHSHLPHTTDNLSSHPSPVLPETPQLLKPKPIKHLHTHPAHDPEFPTPPTRPPEDQFAGQLAVAGWNQSVMLVMHKSTNDHSSKKVPKLFNITRSRRIMDDTTTQWPNSAEAQKGSQSFLLPGEQP